MASGMSNVSRLTREQNDALVNNQIRYVDTLQAYDLWAEVYDTDGNFLQALDTIEMKTLFPEGIKALKAPRPWKAVDLGCGTGRNTSNLVEAGMGEIVALDLSSKMLELARRKIGAGSNAPKVHFDTFDMIASPEVPERALAADMIVSTLVIEHVPADVFFRTCAKILKPEGILVLTNMHSDMGSISQAGFIDPKTGEKIRPVSYPHTVAATVDAAKRDGFVVIGEIKEVSVDEVLAQRLGPNGNKWIGVTVWYGGLLRKVATQP